MIKNRLKEMRLTMLIEHQKDMALLLGIRQEQYNRYESNTMYIYGSRYAPDAAKLFVHARKGMAKQKPR